MFVDGSRLSMLFVVSFDFLGKISCFWFHQVVQVGFGYFPFLTVV